MLTAFNLSAAPILGQIKPALRIAVPITNILLGQTYDDLIANLADIHNQRLRYMDEAGVDYMVLSLTSPGIQEIGNAALAESLATQANNDFAALIANKTDRLEHLRLCPCTTLLKLQRSFAAALRNLGSMELC